MLTQPNYQKKVVLQFAKIVLFFSNNSSMRLYKTKLNKLLFYSQFLFYKKYNERLFEGDFICDYYGPVLEDLDYFLKILNENEIIKIDYTE
ncbi:MAG: DUF4065 domain-containing protein [Halanaerobiales bacterium]|nr:DUF4065 domain-containing protein [Halanaerobiales bacterium]